MGTAGHRAVMAVLPRRVLVRQLRENADELAELRDARCLLQRDVNALRGHVISKNEQVDALVSDLAGAFARIRTLERELAQAEAELRAAGTAAVYRHIRQEDTGHGRKGGPRGS